MENVFKEVYYHAWCPICEYSKLEEDEEPCDDCLNEPMNVDSHKPLYFKEKEKKK